MNIFPEPPLSRHANPVLSPHLIPGLAPNPCDCDPKAILAGSIPLRPLGWAGLLLCIPADYRLAKVKGSGPRGRLDLVDARRIRLTLEWQALPQSFRRFDPQRHIDGEFKKLAVKFRDSKPVGQRWRAVANPAFAPLGCYTSDAVSTDFYVGYCPATRRVIRVTYHHADPSCQIEDQIFRTLTMPGLCDQPATASSRWCVFDVSFIAPPGLQLGATRLDLGDMRVELWSGPAREKGPSLGLREIYPAQLALTRQSMEAWLRQWLRVFAPVYMPKSTNVLRRRPPAITPIQTARGPGVTIDLHLRWTYRPFFRRAPRTLRLWLFEDQAVGRLLGVSVGAAPDQLDAGLEQMLQGLHWAGIGG